MSNVVNRAEQVRRHLSSFSVDEKSSQYLDELDSTNSAQTRHYNDWPNAQGFDTTYEERNPVELQVEGNIPSYAAGTLYRTGLGPRSVDCGDKGVFRVNHWFDNFGQVHRFQIKAPERQGDRARVIYNSRLTSDGLIEKVRRVGRLDGMTFAAKYEPCKTFFQKLQSWFLPASRLLPKPQQPTQPNEVNVGVTMTVNYPGLNPVGGRLDGVRDTTQVTSFCTKTDAAIVQMLDSETLEPIGLARQEILHPDLNGPMSAAHAKSDPITGDVYNFNLQFGGPQGTYRVFRTSADTGRTSILATFRHTPAYIHSLFLTENYVVLCVWNSQFKQGGLSLLLHQNIVDSMDYNATNPARWYVIDKRCPESEDGQSVVATYESPPFFGFHSVNAYETNCSDGTKSIIADIPAYQSLQVLKAFYFDNILSDSPTAGQLQGQWGDSLAPKYRRYRFPDVPAQPRREIRQAVTEFELPRDDTPELPMINFSRYTKKHRYVYGICDSGKSTFADSLIKLDLETKSVLRWSVHGQTAGEPVFIADPESNEEDGGVLLSVVLDGVSGKSYLLVLDARDLSELGRAKANGAIGFGFHGLHTKLRVGSGQSGGAVSPTPDF